MSSWKERAWVNMGKERAQVNMDWDKRIWKLARKTFPRAQDDQAEGSGEFSFVCLFVLLFLFFSCYLNYESN